MKLLTQAQRSLIKMQDAAQRLLFAAMQLEGGTQTSAQIVISPQVAANNATTPKTPAIPAVISPPVTPNPLWIGSTRVDRSNDAYVLVISHLPVSPAYMAKGLPANVKMISEATTPQTDLGAWLGGAIGSVEAEQPFTGTLEQYLYSSGLSCQSFLSVERPASVPAPMISPSIWRAKPGDVGLSCIRVEIALPKIDNNSHPLAVTLTPNPFNGGGND